MRPTPFRALPPALEADRFISRARHFRRAAIPMADMEGPEPNWPKYFLVTHAIELAIRAFNVFRADLEPPAKGPTPRNHDLVGLYDYAVNNGLPRDPVVTTELPHLSDLHEIHYARYPKAEVKPVALISHFDDIVEKLFADVERAIALYRR
jgi:hypothetical protein